MTSRLMPLSAAWLLWLVATSGWAVPPVVDGLRLQLDATNPSGDGTVPALGSRVETWTDLSGSGNHATTFPGGGPQYSANQGDVPYLAFSGANIWLATDPSSDFAGPEATVFTVAFSRSGSVFAVAEPGTSNNQMEIYAASTRTDTRPLLVQHGTDAANYVRSDNAVVGAGPYVHEALFGQAADAVANVLNGMPSTTDLLTEGSPQPFPDATTRAAYVGRAGDLSAPRGRSAWITEVLYYDRQLWDLERQQVGLYLSQKYEIATAYVPEPSTGVLLAAGMGTLWSAIGRRFATGSRRRLAVRQ